MLDFKKLELAHIEDVAPIMNGCAEKICDWSIGGIFMWRKLFDTEIAFYKKSEYSEKYRDYVFFKSKSYEGETFFSLPLACKCAHEACSHLENYCMEQDIPLAFSFITEREADILKARYGDYAEVTLDRHFSDYIYKAADLAEMAGRRYAGQRNHINKFLKLYPDFHTEPMTAENMPDVRAFFDRMHEKALAFSEKRASVSFLAEKEALDEVMDHFDLYRQMGLVLYAGDEIAAASFGEIIGDTLFVHAEKADLRFGGAYQMMVREFSRAYSSSGVVYINREDDAGDEGLRTSKLSYHPAAILDKYTVRIDRRGFGAVPEIMKKEGGCGCHERT